MRISRNQWRRLPLELPANARCSGVTENETSVELDAYYCAKSRRSNRWRDERQRFPQCYRTAFAFRIERHLHRLFWRIARRHVESLTTRMREPWRHQICDRRGLRAGATGAHRNRRLHCNDRRSTGKLSTFSRSETTSDIFEGSDLGVIGRLDDRNACRTLHLTLRVLKRA